MVALTFEKRRTPYARWASRTALFAAQLVILAILLHRFAGFSTPIFINMVLASIAIAACAIVLALLALSQIWRFGDTGLFSAFMGLMIGGMVAGWPAASAHFYFTLPAINDISTDTANPPRIDAGSKVREPGANSTLYPAVQFASLQQKHYPDIRPLVVARGETESYELTREILRRMGWDVLAERAPRTLGAGGEIEAEDRTTIMGFRDDVVIRLKGDRDQTRIDIRSASRYGTHDLGRNAKRVRRLLRELYVRLDLGLPLEQEEVRDRRRRVRKKPQIMGPQLPVAPQATQPGQARPGAQRAPGQKVEPRGQAANRARDRQRQRPQE